MLDACQHFFEICFECGLGYRAVDTSKNHERLKRYISSILFAALQSEKRRSRAAEWRKCASPTLEEWRCDDARCFIGSELIEK